MFTSINPANGEVIGQYPVLNEAQINTRIEAAWHAQPRWAALGFAERGNWLRQVARVLNVEREALAEIMAQEMGKPVSEGVAEVDKAAWCAEHYAEHAAHYLAPQTLPSDAQHSYICHQPLGSVLCILPWNMPVWLALRSMGPALMAGNTCVMKHDAHTQGVSLALMSVFHAAGLPEGVMVDLPVDHAGAALAIALPHIAAISFTGSSAGGAKVAATAAGHLKRTVLELGGSDPCVVLADADQALAVEGAARSRLVNAGQSCIAAKRIIIEAPIYDEFVERLRLRLKAVKVGDPLDPATELGPLARADLRDNLARQVRESIDAGARCLLGGEPAAGPGFFYPPTLLTEVTPAMACFREETFGPVACAVRARDADHALELANQTDYGLGAAVWTESSPQAERFAVELQAGQVAVNGIVKTDPRLPSGGIKNSGYGRELGPHGIREFVNVKQVWIGGEPLVPWAGE